MSFLRFRVICTIAAMALFKNSAAIVENSWTERLLDSYVATKIVRHPWQLFLFTEQLSSSVGACGAVLLSSTWAVTTEKCIASATSATVLGGGTAWVDMMLGKEGVQIPVDESVVYPRSDAASDSPAHNLALLKLNDTAQLSWRLKPVALPPPALHHDSLVGETVTVAGWGTTSGYSELMSPRLQAARLTVLDEEQCAAAYGESLLSAGVFCARGKYFSAAGICKGDSGGAVTYTKSGTTYLVGVAEFRDSSCSADAPTGAIDITYYLPWIRIVTGLY